jgi:phospholipid-translocating ATPase
MGIKQPLSIEHTLWANTILASSGFILGMILYTGNETKFRLNSQKPKSKYGKFDLEINFLAKILFVLMLFMAFSIVVISGFRGYWGLDYFRYLLLLSYIVPLSLRTNLDIGKLYYSIMIAKDDTIKGTIPRNSQIPEELGRI